MRRWGPAVVIAAAVAYGVALRWWHLGAASLWFDEGYTAWVVSLSPGQVVAAIRVDTAPPLYYLLLRAWVALAGTTEAATRAPSAACATAALGVMAAVAWRLFRDPWARATAVAVVACSFMQVAYAHEVRFYALMSLAGAVDLYLAIRCCEARSWRWVAAAAVAWAASLWLNNVMAIYLAWLAVAWLALPGGRSVRGPASRPGRGRCRRGRGVLALGADAAGPGPGGVGGLLDATADRGGPARRGPLGVQA